MSWWIQQPALCVCVCALSVMNNDFQFLWACNDVCKSKSHGMLSLHISPPSVEFLVALQTTSLVRTLIFTYSRVISLFFFFILISPSLFFPPPVVTFLDLLHFPITDLTCEHWLTFHPTVLSVTIFSPLTTYPQCSLLCNELNYELWNDLLTLRMLNRMEY